MCVLCSSSRYDDQCYTDSASLMLSWWLSFRGWMWWWNLGCQCWWQALALHAWCFQCLPSVWLTPLRRTRSTVPRSLSSWPENLVWLKTGQLWQHTAPSGYFRVVKAQYGEQGLLLIKLLFDDLFFSFLHKFKRPVLYNCCVRVVYMWWTHMFENKTK